MVVIESANGRKYSINQLGLGGMNTFDDPKDISDNQGTEIVNMVAEGGVMVPRPGTVLHADAPATATDQAFQLLIATNSNGTDFPISVFGSEFYLYDEKNQQQVKLNQSYTPANKGIFYGSTNYTGGIGYDRFYFGNGIDETMRWVPAVAYLASNASSGATTITVDDALGFLKYDFVGNPTISIASPAVISLPAHGLSVGDIVSFSTVTAIGVLPTGISAGTKYYVISSGFTADQFEISLTQGGSAINTSGTQSGDFNLFTYTLPIMVVNNGTVINLKYNNISGNVITLTTTVGASVIAGSTVVSPIVSRPNLPPGSAYSVFQKSRLVISAGQQTENTVYVSYFGEPESQLEDDTVNSAVQSEVNKGRGGIIDIEDFGEYLMIRKNDVSFRYYFSFSSDMTTFEPASDTVVTGDGTGPVNQGANINYMNAVYSVTASEGIVRIYPDTTGTQTTTKLELKSRNVQNLVTEVLDFTDARTAAYRQKIYFACSNPILKDVKTPNNAVLVYDVLRDSWVIFKNWNCADIKKVNDKLIMLSLNDGGLYECLTTYQDMVGTNVLPYTASLSTKRMDFGEPSSVSKNQYLYVQGIITTNTTFYVDVLYNEGGYLGIVTYKIDGSDTKIAHKVVKGGLGVFPFAVPLLGGVDLLTMKSLQDPAFFRCYLQLNQSFVVSSLQARCYSVEAGSYWGITNMTTITQTQQDIIPTSLVVGPSEAPQS